MTSPFRITPNLPVEAYTTFALSSPKGTHTKQVSCSEVAAPCNRMRDGKRVCFEMHCGPHAHGWTTRVPVHSPLADFLAGGTHGRRFTETTSITETGEREFMFPPGQECFRSSEHWVEVGREPIATLRGGDWRGKTTEVRKMALPEWVERFALNQQKIKETHDRGAA